MARRSEPSCNRGATRDVTGAAAILGGRMAREYKEGFDVPPVEVPCWPLLARIADLFERHLPGDGMFSLTAEDARGTYRRDNYGEFRRAVDDETYPPESISLFAEGHEPGGHQRAMFVITSRGDNVFGGYVTSSDEMLVDHVKRRVEGLFELAVAGKLTEPAARNSPASPVPRGGYGNEPDEELEYLLEQHALEQADRPRPRPPGVPRVYNVVTDVQPIERLAPRRATSRVLNHPWMIAVGSGILLLVLGLIIRSV
jgi:hypothetical protein